MASGRPSSRRHSSATTSVAVVDGEVGLHGLGALGEQRHGRAAQRVVARQPAGAWLHHRQSQRAHGHLPLATDPQWLPAGHQHVEPGAAAQQVVDQRRGGDDLLEVVQHQQQVFLLKVRAQ
jgi:hypothetical protein